MDVAGIEPATFRSRYSSNDRNPSMRNGYYTPKPNAQAIGCCCSAENQASYTRCYFLFCFCESIERTLQCIDCKIQFDYLCSRSLILMLFSSLFLIQNSCVVVFSMPLARFCWYLVSKYLCPLQYIFPSCPDHDVFLCCSFIVY